MSVNIKRYQLTFVACIYIVCFYDNLLAANTLNEPVNV